MSAKTGPDIVCERCGKVFHVKPIRAQRWKPRYCSRACRDSDPGQFWSHVDRGGGEDCWPWTGSASRTQGRYGSTTFDGRHRLAHQIAFKLTHGFYPPYVRHSCDFGLCCNPAHLLEGTHQENMDDKVARGRQARGSATKLAKLTEDIVLAIRADPRRNKDIAAQYGVDAAHISRVKRGLIWKHI